MPKICHEQRQSDVMEEILQDPAKFEELLKEREKQKVVRKIASSIPSRNSERIRSSEREDTNDGPGERCDRVSHYPWQNSCRKIRCGSHRSSFKAPTSPRTTIGRSLTKSGSSGAARTRCTSMTETSYARTDDVQEADNGRLQVPNHRQCVTQPKTY